MRDTPENRLEAADMFAHALRATEKSAARAAARAFSPDIVFSTGDRVITGVAGVIDRLTTVWPMSPVFARGVWRPATLVSGQVIVTADFQRLGAAPRNYRLVFRFDEEGQIAHVEELYDFPLRGVGSTVLPAHVCSIINNALADGRPLAVAYVTDHGEPAISLRGSIQVLAEMQLCAWIRDASGGLARVAERRGAVSMLYRDSGTRTTLNIRTYSCVAHDEQMRKRIYDLIPEVEQTHDLAMKGAALIFDVQSVLGTHPDGPILVQADV
jgi:hypothetical protein